MNRFDHNVSSTLGPDISFSCDWPHISFLLGRNDNTCLFGDTIAIMNSTVHNNNDIINVKEAGIEVSNLV